MSAIVKLNRLVVAKNMRHAAMSVTVNTESSDWVFAEHDNNRAARFASGMRSNHWKVYPVTLTIEVEEPAEK